MSELTLEPSDPPSPRTVATRRALLLHTTCCYFQDNLHLNAELEEPLAARGVEVTHVLTDGHQCTYRYHLPDPQDVHCAQIRDRSWRYLTTTKHKVFSLAEFASQESSGPTWTGNVEDLDELHHRGLRLWPVIQASVVKALQWDSLQDRLAAADAREVSTIAAFLASAARYLDKVDAMLAELAPTDMLLFNGMFYLERIAGELARRRDIRTIATESCCFWDRKYFDPAGVIGNRHSYGATKHQIEVRHLDQDEEARLRHFLQASYDGRNNFIRQGDAIEAPVRDQLRIPQEKRIATFWGQVPSDSVLVCDSPLFDGQFDAIAATVELFRQRPEWHLVLKLHPGREGRTPAQRRLEERLETLPLPPTVSVVRSRGANSYDLMRESDIGITVCSQAGLEMLGMHKRIVVLGNAFYAGLGFTTDVAVRAAYPACLDWALAHPRLDRGEQREVDAFLYGLIFEHLVPVDRDAGHVLPDAVERVVGLFS